MEGCLTPAGQARVHAYQPPPLPELSCIQRRRRRLLALHRGPWALATPPPVPMFPSHRCSVLGKTTGRCFTHCLPLNHSEAVFSSTLILASGSVSDPAAHSTTPQKAGHLSHVPRLQKSAYRFWRVNISQSETALSSAVLAQSGTDATVPLSTLASGQPVRVRWVPRSTQPNWILHAKLEIVCCVAACHWSHTRLFRCNIHSHLALRLKGVSTRLKWRQEAYVPQTAEHQPSVDE